MNEAQYLIEAERRRKHEQRIKDMREIRQTIQSIRRFYREYPYSEKHGRRVHITELGK